MGRRKILAKIIKEIFFVDTENIAFLYNKKISTD
jgi:hypothetical protein